MSTSTKIEWTDHTWNPIRGCTKVSPGCAHCYAETFAERFRGVSGHPYEQGFDLRLVPEKLAEPLKWRTPRMIFVNSMSDLFHKDVPDNYICSTVRVLNTLRGFDGRPMGSPGDEGDDHISQPPVVGVTLDHEGGSHLGAARVAE